MLGGAEAENDQATNEQVNRDGNSRSPDCGPPVRLMLNIIVRVLPPYANLRRAVSNFLVFTIAGWSWEEIPTARTAFSPVRSARGKRPEEHAGQDERHAVIAAVCQLCHGEHGRYGEQAARKCQSQERDWRQTERDRKDTAERSTRGDTQYVRANQVSCRRCPGPVRPAPPPGLAAGG
jgi:cytochrome c553